MSNNKNKLANALILSCLFVLVLLSCNKKKKYTSIDDYNVKVLIDNEQKKLMISKSNQLLSFQKDATESVHHEVIKKGEKEILSIKYNFVDRNLQVLDSSTEENVSLTIHYQNHQPHINQKGTDKLSDASDNNPLEIKPE